MLLNKSERMVWFHNLLADNLQDVSNKQLSPGLLVDSKQLLPGLLLDSADYHPEEEFCFVIPNIS